MIFFLIGTSFAFAEDLPKYRITPPPGWKDRHQASHDLLRQIVEPDNNAMIEIYYSKGNAPNLLQLADVWEATARKRGLPYLTTRKSSRLGRFLYKNAEAVHRTYSGSNKGVALSSMVSVTQYDGFVLIVVGVYPTGHDAYSGPLIKAFQSFKPGPKSAGTKPCIPFQSTSIPKACGAADEGSGSRQEQEWHWIFDPVYGFWAKVSRRLAISEQHSPGTTETLACFKEKQSPECRITIWADKVMPHVQPAFLQQQFQMIEPYVHRLNKVCANSLFRRAKLMKNGVVSLVHEFAGTMDGKPCRTFTIFAVDPQAGRGYALLGSYHVGDEKGRKEVFETMLRFRLTRPSDSQIKSTNGIYRLSKQVRQSAVGPAPSATGNPGHPSPEALVRTYYAYLEKEDIQGMRTILAPVPGVSLEDSIASYRLIFEAVDQKISRLAIKGKRLSTDHTGCAVSVHVRGVVTRSDGKERFSVNAPFIVGLRKSEGGAWKIERVARKTAVDLSAKACAANQVARALIEE